MDTGSGTDASARLRARLAPLADLRGLIDLLSFDQETVMPRAGVTARGQQEATLHALLHDGLIAPELQELLDEVRASGANGDDAALARVVGRDADKARRVPTALVHEMALAGSTGQEAWITARRNDDFAAFLPHLERNIELRREYAACFDVAEPYDALLDDYEPGLLTGELHTLFAPLREELPGLVAAAARTAPDLPAGPFPIDGQRRAVDLVLRRVGFNDHSWLLADSVHPFSATPGYGDNRITTRYSEDSLESISSALHEFGHGLYEAQIDPALARTQLGRGTSMVMHESQSRLWELFVGGSVSFWRGVWPEFTAALGGAPGGHDPESFVAALAGVRPSLIRVDADAVSYLLHIILRFDLELALVSGDLAARDLPGAWRDGMRALLDIDVPDDSRGVLQDVHWSLGAFGYFPTYGVGTILAAQIWESARTDLPDIDAQLEAGDLTPLRGWLADHLHHHGKRLETRELVRGATGTDLDTGPYLDFARACAGGAPPQ